MTPLRILTGKEYVNTFGEVQNEKIIVYQHPHADSYDQWDKKRSNHVFIPEEDRKILAAIFSVAEKFSINAPNTLLFEVLWFFKKARALRNKVGKPLYYSNPKSVLAVMYIVAKHTGFISVANAIRAADCGGTTCFPNKKYGDKEFKKYLNAALKYASIIYRGSPNRDPVLALKSLRETISFVPDFVIKKAMEYAEIIKETGALAGRTMSTIVAACIRLALENIFAEKKKVDIYYKNVVKALGVSPQSVRSFLNNLAERGIINTA